MIAQNTERIAKISPNHKHAWRWANEVNRLLSKEKNTKGRLIYILNVQHPDPSVKYRLKSLWDFISLQTEWPRSRNKSRIMLARLGGKRDFFSVQTEGGRTCEATIAINMELHAKIKNRITIWPSYPILNIGFWLVCFFFDIDYEVLWRML